MASVPNPVKVIEVCRVAPPPPPPPPPPTTTASPDSAAPTSLPLTFFDVFWLRFPPVRRLFFYELASSSSHPTPAAFFFEIVLPKLKHSLSLTLQHYLPLAGNLTWPPHSDKPTIQYVAGDALSLTIAESEADFYHVSGDSFHEAEEFHPFLPNLPASDTRVPVMALQVILFPNTGGFSIGYAIHHAVLDGKTIALFMHSWASICRHGEHSTLTPELTPFYDRTIVNDPADLETTYLNGWMDQNGPNNKSLMRTWDLKAPPDTILGTFRLTQANIENMKKCVHAQWQEKHKQKPSTHLSTFTITSAYVWVCLVRTLKMRSPKKVRLIIGVDSRARLEPPLPSTYFGNCVSACIVYSDSNDLIGEDGVAMAAKAIGEAIRGLNDGVLKGAEDWMSIFFSVREGLFSIAGSPRLEMYNTDFGWGRPRKVELTSIKKSGAFCLQDSRNGDGGIEIGIALKKHEIEAFASLFASGLRAH